MHRRISSKIELLWRTTRSESHCSEENFSQCFCRYDEVDCERSIWQLSDAYNEKLMFIANKMFIFRSFDDHTEHESLHFRVDEREDSRDLNVHFNQQVIDLFVNAIKTNAIKNNVNISLWNARNSTLKKRRMCYWNMRSSKSQYQASEIWFYFIIVRWRLYY